MIGLIDEAHAKSGNRDISAERRLSPIKN